MRKCNLNYVFWGRSAEVQKKYRNLLTTSKWNENQLHMSKYSALEAVLIKKPDFDNLDDLTPKIIETADTPTSEIMQYIKSI